MSTKDFEKLSVREVFELLGSGFSGLSEEEARKRLSIYGFNVVEEKKESFFIDVFEGVLGSDAMASRDCCDSLLRYWACY